MSSERQRNMRLQGRHTAPKRNSSSPLASGYQSSSPISSDGSPSFEYRRTDTVVERKPKPPINLNEQKMFREWIEISRTDNGPSLIYFDPDFISKEKSDEAEDLLDCLPWEEREIVVKGEKYVQPRLVHWIGPHQYKYSSVILQPNDNWPDTIKLLRHDIERLDAVRLSGDTFNSVLCNMYRNEHDSVAWHSDNELSLGVKPLIASVSFGEARKFEMKRKCQSLRPDDLYIEDVEYLVHLDHGSLFLMNGAMQEDWLHRVPKEKHNRARRINLTFRTVHPL